tara:strand:+ start:7057 stop:7695 length:639 start_codon:yes stop_codon:yes gene_type:complete
LDVVLEVLTSRDAGQDSITFQSLFCWMLFWKCTDSPNIFALFSVSILILLDVVLEERGHLFCRSVLPVSILILLDVVLEAYISIHVVSSGIMFQSLFCWMLFWKFELVQYFPTKNQVSILILLDVVLEACFGCAVDCHRLVSILILLDVVLEGCYPCIMCNQEEGFNPYSVGCCSGRSITALAESPRESVSILILLDVVLEDSCVSYYCRIS